MTFLTVLVIIVCVLLLLIVLIQNPKGGLDSAFSTNNQVMGVRKTTDFLEKATWTLGIALVVLSIASAAIDPSTAVDETQNESEMMEQIDNAAEPIQNVPQLNAAPAPADGGATNAGGGEEEEK